ncbi:MAG: tyrosine-type recombinase/integrase [Planctomycetes bacterium]|nr:tyrosine-type recombinase/integrase [Planctomycetota bacterium]
MLLDDALGKFLVQLEADGRSQHTIGQYRRHVRLLGHWMAQVGHTDAISSLDHECIARFLASPTAKRRPDGQAKKATAVNCLRSSLRVFFGYLHQAGFIAQNPGRMIRRAVCGNPPPRALTPEEKDRLLATLATATGPEAERDHLLFSLMLTTGIRLSAALGLKVEDLNLDAGEITIHTKGDRVERVYLPQSACDHLRRFIGERKTGPLFTSRDGRQVCIRHIQRRFQEWLRKAGITRPLSPHSTRHSFAVDLYRRTHDLLLVKAALHHRSIASTLVYAQASGDELRKAMA